LTAHPAQGYITRRTWTEDELAEAEALINLCNAYEDLRIKLATTMLRSRSGDETNDFLYYEDGKLVGLLALDDFQQADREMTGLVHPDYRRRGIFTDLLTMAKAEGRARGIKRLVIVCERFSRSGMAFVEAVGAQYDSSEHLMYLQDFRPRNAYQPLLTLTQATPDDMDDIAHILATSFHEDEAQTRQRLPEDLQYPGVTYYIARHGSQPVSCLNVYLGDDASAGIYAFGVVPQYRRLGLGRQVLERIITLIQAEYGDQRRIQLEVETSNNNAIALYHSCGFSEVTTYGYYNLDLA
jgi:ribosomal protein S18 acetylase RimI-like enzyme